MTQVKRTWCLHLPDWPDPDRRAWEAAIRDGDWLDDAGPGAHLRPKTRLKYVESYGHWFAWLSDAGLLDPSVRPADRVTSQRLFDYAAWMRDRVAPVTARMRIEDLDIVLNLTDPRQDRDLFARLLERMPKTPVRDKRLQMRDPIELIALGETLMASAEENAFGRPRFDAVHHRDGLLIALTAWRPIRRRNLAAIRIGEHLLVKEDGFRITIPADETKGGRFLDMTWPETFILDLRRYLDHWRPILLGTYPDPGALWLAGRGGRPLSAHTLACNFRRHTEAAFGVAIGPHLFRDAAATMMALRDPANMRATAAVLGHRSYQTTQKHYNLARQVDAVSALQSSIAALLSEEEAHS